MCKTNPSRMRQCVICSKQLYGRSDKRFCDITCKNYYHSEVRKSMKTVQSETLKILTKNYVILTGILGDKHSAFKIDKLELERQGFRFNYVTDAVVRNGEIHFGVFEMNYRIRNKRIYIHVDSQRKPVSPYIFERWSREISETDPTFAQRCSLI